MGSNPASFVLAPLMWVINYLIIWPLKKIIRTNKYFILAVHTTLDFTIHIMNIPLLETTEVDESVTDSKREQVLLVDGLFIYLLDYYFLNNYAHRIWFLNDRSTRLTSVKLKQVGNNKFYSFWHNPNKINNTSQILWYGLHSVWKHLRYWLIPITIFFLFVYYSFVIKSLPFSKIVFAYIILGNLVYLLLSGFVFFIKKYQYRLYTSVIQRFWRRTLVVFWLIEASLFTVFVYLIFNASQEPMYVYDTIQIYKTHFYSWRFFLCKIILSSLLITFTYMLLLACKWNSFSKNNSYVLIITIILLYVSWLEFYQMFHLMNSYGSTNWVYDFSEHWWNLELEFKRTRIVNHYVTIGLVAKFWHIVFALVFWVFFVLRGIESSRLRYPLLAANLQNFLIIYLMSWLYMYPWFKFIFRKPLDMPYFWFFVNNRKFFVFLFFNDMKLYWFGLVEFFNEIYQTSVNYTFKKSPLYYFFESSNQIGFSQFRKHHIRDLVLNKINKSVV